MPPNKVASECEVTDAPTHSGSPKYCPACKEVYCDTCYDSQRPHRIEANRLNGHEKTDLDTANFVLALFNINFGAEEQKRQHQDNIRTKWFGTSVDNEQSKSYFHDFGGFLRLLHESKLPANQQFPSLVSFVGRTGSGKSTLINTILKVHPLT